MIFLRRQIGKTLGVPVAEVFGSESRRERQSFLLNNFETCFVLSVRNLRWERQVFHSSLFWLGWRLTEATIYLKTSPLLLMVDVALFTTPFALQAQRPRHGFSSQSFFSASASPWTWSELDYLSVFGFLGRIPHVFSTTGFFRCCTWLARHASHSLALTWLTVARQKNEKLLMNHRYVATSVMLCRSCTCHRDTGWIAQAKAHY
jgi:hypothetical protein